MQGSANWWFIHEGIYSREVVFQSLVETVLRDAKRPLTLAEISQSLSAELKQANPIPLDCITLGIEHSTRVVPSPTVNGAYELTEQGVKEMENGDNTFARDQAMFYTHVLNHVESRLGEPIRDTDKRTRLQAAVDEVLGKLFEEHNLTLATALLQGLNYVFPEDFMQNGLAHELQAALSVMFDETNQLKRERTLLGVRDALTDLPKQALPYLVALHRRFFMLKMIGFDPKLDRMRRNAMAGRQLYLDTNVILAVLFDEHFQHDLATKTLSKCHALGMNLRLTDQTEKEIKGQFDRARVNLSRLSNNPTLLEVASSCGDDIVLVNFVHKYRSLGWPAYQEIYADLEAVLRPFDVKMENTDEEGMALLEAVSSIEHPVTQTIRPYKPDKPFSTTVHDAYHLCLVEQRRHSCAADEFGHCVWFITLDGKLVKAQRDLARLQGLNPPYAKLLPEWLSRISVYEGPDASGFSQTDYVRLVLSAHLGLVPTSPQVSTDFLASLAASKLPLRELSTLPIDILRRVITKLQTDEEINHLITESAVSMDGAAKEVIDERFKVRLEALVKEMADLENERAKELEQYSLSLENTLEEARARASSAAVELEQAEGQMADDQARIQRLEAELARSKKELTDANTRIEEAVAESQGLRLDKTELQRKTRTWNLIFVAAIVIVLVAAGVTLYLMLG